MTHPDDVRLTGSSRSNEDAAESENAEQLHLESLSAADCFRDALTVSSCGCDWREEVS